MQLIEMWIEGRMTQAIPGFNMETFLPELNEFIQSGAAERGDAKKVVDLLNSWADFPSFKEQMLDASKLVFFAIEWGREAEHNELLADEKSFLGKAPVLDLVHGVMCSHIMVIAK